MLSVLCGGKSQQIYQQFNIFFWARGHIPEAADMNQNQSQGINPLGIRCELVEYFSNT